MWAGFKKKKATTYSLSDFSLLSGDSVLARLALLSLDRVSLGSLGSLRSDGQVTGAVALVAGGGVEFGRLGVSSLHLRGGESVKSCEWYVRFVEKERL